jgi:PAS domain S-box-containing protein
VEISELRYRRLFEGARDGVLILDVDTLRIVDANPYIGELLGYARDELLGKELWEIGLFRDEAASRQLARELQANGYVRYDDLPFKSKDGQPREVEVVSNVYQEGDHEVIQCNIRDISERKLVEVQRDRLARAEKLRLIGAMARGVAHDLNQWLGLISGYSDLALIAAAESAQDQPRLREILETMGRAATDAGMTVARLMTFARSEAEGPAEDVPLPELLARVGHLTAPRWRNAAQVEGREVALDVDAEPDAVIVGWPASLREALVNHVFNAIDALPEGGTIRLGAHRRGDEVVVEVRDSGTGMSAEVQARVFEPLFTTKGLHGTGLGLAQVLAAVELHGGRISIDSALGQGTTVRLAFPAARRPRRSTGRDAVGLTILTVDDEPALAELIASLLRVDGHAVVAVNSGAAALDRLGTESFDLVITDMGMPGMDGWELTDQVRSRYPTVPIIIASGWGSQITPDEARERGIRAVVPKPYRLRDLRSAIAALDRAHGTPESPLDHPGPNVGALVQ